MKKLILKLKLLYFKEKLNHANILLYKSRGTNFSTEIRKNVEKYTSRINAINKVLSK